MDQYACERLLYLSYQDMFKKMINKLKENFSEVRKADKNIRLVKLNIRSELKSISKEFKLDKKYDKFNILIKDSTNTGHLLLVIENMNETLNLISSSMIEIEKPYAEIEEISKKKKTRNMK